MSSSRFLVGLASVFAGLTVLSAVVGLVYSPVALVLTVAFLVVTYLLWYQISGRLGRRVRRQARTAGAARTEATSGGRTGGFGARAREEWTGPQGGGRGFGGGARQRESTRQTTGPSTRQAYRTLGLDPGASEAAVRNAYREKAKEHHPDTEGGDERRFKRINEAYERLSE